MVGRVDDRDWRAGALAIAQQRRGEPCGGDTANEGVAQSVQHHVIGKIEPFGIFAARPKDGIGGINVRMGRTGRADLQSFGCRVGNQIVDRDIRIGDAVDEGGVGAVLEQAPHQIGKQRVVRTDRGVDATRSPQLMRADDFLIKRLTHAVEALELIAADLEIGAGQFENGGDGLGVVRRELREDLNGGGEQPFGAGDVGDIGIKLAGIDREIREPIELGLLDLTIPIGPLNQPHHQAMA